MTKRKKTVLRMQSEYIDEYHAQIDRKKRRKKGLIRRLIAMSAVMLLLVGVMVYYHVSQRILYSEKQEQYETLQSEMIQLKKEEKELLEEINLLSDDEYILDIARTNYFLTKEGELIFQIQDDDRSN